MSREDEIRARLDAATPGPWHCYGDHLVWPSEKGPAANDPICHVSDAHAECADLIAHAPDDLRWLRAEVERLKDIWADREQRWHWSLIREQNDAAALRKATERAEQAEAERDHLLRTFFAECEGVRGKGHEHGVWCGSHWVALKTERDELRAKVARVEALVEKWDCSLRAAVPCIELDGAIFPNGAQFTDDMWCDACRLRDALRGDS